MKRESGGPCLSAVFVDYDNIYLSLKRKDEDAAKRFAKDAGLWIRAIESGKLITPTGSIDLGAPRRIVMNRCYGNPVPRRNPRDNSTDMSSFPFVRHHFLRAGFEIIDCPPLTAQLKNSSDIRMVMDVRDFLTHETYFDEFIILSSDADFTPVLHRLRAHARRTIIYANEQTASPYTAICDGEVKEMDLVRLLTKSEGASQESSSAPVSVELPRLEILELVAEAIYASDKPVPLEVLADKATRSLGHDRTIGTSWAGFGSFRAFLAANLPDDIRLTEQAPFLAFEPKRHGQPGIIERRPPQIESPVVPASKAIAPPVTIEVPELPMPNVQPAMTAPVAREPAPAAAPLARQIEPTLPMPPQAVAPPAVRKPAPPPAAPAPQIAKQPANLQASIARIHEACQAPPLAPQDYRTLFEVMALEINENNLSGAQTISNIQERASARGLEVKRDDVRFVLDVVSEADPWFEQGASPNLFAGRFRNFAVARCRGQGLNLTADELDLIDAWFAGGPVGAQMAQRHASYAQQQIAMERAAQAADTGGAGDFAGQDVLNMPRFVRQR
ncbi:MAG: NYN domain-containing protein [Hyphomicrobiaceae bacterium]